jgi:hypothetical protein
MNIDELKTAWKEYDTKLQSTQKLTDRMVASMIGERSRSRISRAQRSYVAALVYMFVVLGFCIAVFFGNPFDFRYWYQYAIIVGFVFCISVFIISLITIVAELRRIDIAQQNLDTSLKKIIGIYEKPRKLAYRTGGLVLILTVLFPLSFLPRSIQFHGVLMGIVLQVVPIALSILMIYGASKLGAFKDRFGEKFKEDLRELNELKAMSKELMDN